MVYLQGHIFNLGNGIHFETAEDAAKKLLQREVPEVLEAIHNAIFIPNAFIYPAKNKIVSNNKKIPNK